MRVRFWGTRGSFAKPGPNTVRYGGNTSCVEVCTDGGTRIVIDCGTGGHDLGRAILAEPGPSRGHMLISHTHWDHIQGIPFFAPFFAPGHRWDIYAPQGFGESLAETLAGQMEYTYFPVTPEAFAADVRYRNLGEGGFRIEDASIRTCFLNHPALTLGFRIEADGATLVYACDHEPHARHLASGEGAIDGQDGRHAEFVEGADLLIHDAQYRAGEYGAKVGWGHSTAEYAVAVARHAGVRRLALTHHDPARTDDDIDRCLVELRAGQPPGDPLEILAATEGAEIVLRGERERPISQPPPATPDALGRADPARPPVLLLACADEALSATIETAIAAEPVELVRAQDGGTARALLAGQPALAILDGALSKAAGAAVEGGVPTMILGRGAAPATLDRDTDWLEAPFSVQYARTRIRTWLLRGECHWERAPFPPNEDARVAALHDLGLLDSAREERFDRHTRIAAALFGVPVSLITLVDGDRQWFKSCIGTDVCETSREVSFCAHALAANDMLVVPDTLKDRRFRDNPMVSGPPHVRFYAGAPVYLPSGHCAGTLCILDVRPRDLDAQQRALLADLAKLVEAELAVEANVSWTVQPSDQPPPTQPRSA